MVVFFSPIEVRVEEEPVAKKPHSDAEMFMGTLDMMIRRTLIGGVAQRHTVGKV